MTISANNLTVDAAADITLDAGDADVSLQDDCYLWLIRNSSGNLVIKSGSTTALTFLQMPQ